MGSWLVDRLRCLIPPVTEVSPRRLTRFGLLAATTAIGLEHNSPAAQFPWALVAALPLTPPAGFLTFWYLPPGLALGVLLAWRPLRSRRAGNEPDQA